MSPFFTGSSVPSPRSSDQPPGSRPYDIAMSALAKEFCNLKIWRLDVVGSSNGASFNGYLSALSEDMSVRSDKAFSRMDFIDRKLLSILSDIAGVMIEGGYGHMLRRAIDRNSAQLASSILDINNIVGGHKEESKEILLKIWTTVMHIIVGFLSEMQRQLNGQDLGYFNRLKEDYFLAIAKQTVMKLLKAAGSICIQGASIDPVYKDTYSTLKPDLSKMLNVVMMYQALNYGMPTILALLSGQTKEFILAEGEGLIHRLSDMFVKLSVEQNYLVRSQCLDISDTGVHRSTRHIMDHMRMLVQQKTTVYLMLKGDQKAFSELVVQLISSLEFMLDMNSRGLQLQGQQQMFLLNNVHFMLQEVKIDNDLGLILGEGWLLQRHDQLNQFVTGYVDVSWTPVMSCFQRRTRVPEILWPRQLFDKFTSSFEMAYRVQKTWKVTDPLIRHKVREAIFQKVIPDYRIHMENYSEKQKSERYSIEQLESQLQELFEG
ncbi:exocyst complex component EXO70A1-like [Panicum miliaceum]|uniref:Exocyst subunit Exo70 family protein n=1 Tax=Panicum miliaceum TaxID=4540 RepID=A0A3L6SS50_PANMI|nr:exocyst complex component EXO70A1-like [Panicum miliaceum]